METCAVYDSKGEFLAMGVTGIVELLDTGQVTKSPRPDDEALCRKDMTTEAEVYRRLEGKSGSHRPFLQCIAFDEATAVLTMEYMPHGTLRNYLLSPDNSITSAQRHQWALTAAEGLAILHSLAVVHCDFSPKNMLLDGNLALKISDFGCSSIDGKSSTGGGSVRFYPDARACPNWKAQHDVFALGSTIYEIFVGRPPYHDVPSSRAERIFPQGVLPDLTGVGIPVEMQRIVRECWCLGSRDASSVYRMMASLQVVTESES